MQRGKFVVCIKPFIMPRSSIYKFPYYSPDQVKEWRSADRSFAITFNRLVSEWLVNSCYSIGNNTGSIERDVYYIKSIYIYIYIYVCVCVCVCTLHTYKCTHKHLYQPPAIIDNWHVHHHVISGFNIM